MQITSLAKSHECYLDTHLMSSAASVTLCLLILLTNGEASKLQVPTEADV